MDEVIVIGVNHESTPLEYRERLDFSKRKPQDYLARLADVASLSSGMVLSTCNRVEIYATGGDGNALVRDGVDFLGQFHALSAEELQKFVYTKVNRDAVKHLFRVASSLDSMIVGEPQILGQVKEAYLESPAKSLTSPFFDRLLRKTFSVAKRVRTETKIAEQAVSISYAAVELSKKIFGNLQGRTVMVVGAGEMAELAARHLRRQNVQKIIFTNRSYEHSVDLAKEFEGVPTPLNRFSDHLDESDIVIVSTGAPNYLIERHHLVPVLSRRRREPMFLIDISVPRNVDPDVHELEDIYLYNIDDLKGIVETNLRTREQEAEKAEAIVEFEVDRFFETVKTLKVTPTIRMLQQKYENVRKLEMERLIKRLAHLNAEDLARLEKTTESLVKKILNDPIVFLKRESEKEKAGDGLELIHQIFELEKDEDEEA